MHDTSGEAGRFSTAAPLSLFVGLQGITRPLAADVDEGRRVLDRYALGFLLDDLPDNRVRLRVAEVAELAQQEKLALRRRVDGPLREVPGPHARILLERGPIREKRRRFQMLLGLGGVC